MSKISEFKIPITGKLGLIFTFEVIYYTLGLVNLFV